jgi:hypothetical protein
LANIAAATGAAASAAGTVGAAGAGAAGIAGLGLASVGGVLVFVAASILVIGGIIAAIVVPITLTSNSATSNINYITLYYFNLSE